jgi:hypothetical protein
MVKDDAGAYELQTTRGRRVKLSSSAELANHVGHEVKLSGAFIDAPESDGSKPGASPSDAKHGHAAGREFQVVKVEVIADSCTLTSPKRTK